MNKVILHQCPTCGAKENEPCRTPKGRRKNNTHDTRPFGLIINMNEHPGVECRVCGDITTPDHGVPMYEDTLLPNDWPGEWFGQPACLRCFEIQSKLTKPMRIS